MPQDIAFFKFETVCCVTSVHMNDADKPKHFSAFTEE